MSKEQLNTITLCMIVKDEESSLARCLESVKDEVDEIIIVDTGSTDGTVDIARRYTDKVYLHPWENDFSKHRNQCLAYATGDWVFQLDADEELESRSRPLLRETVRNASADAFDIGILCHMNDGTSTSFHRFPRLFRNNGVIRYEGIVHNQVVGYRGLENSDITIIHHGYDVDQETSLKRFNRTAALLIEQIRRNPLEPEPYINLSTSFLSVGKYPEALDAGRRAVAIMERQNCFPGMGTIAYYNQATCHFNLNDFTQMVSAGLACLSHYPDDIDSCIALCLANRGLERWDEVIRWGGAYLTRVKRLDKTCSRIVMSLADTWKAHLFMGEAYLHRGEVGRAVDHFHEAIASPRHRAVCLNAVIKIMTHLRSFAEARPFVDLAVNGADCPDAVAAYEAACRASRDRGRSDREEGVDRGGDPRRDRPLLSLCMIVRNEAAVLGRCLGSVRDHVDEIVVVDTGSTDDTVAIAARFGARVYHHPWQDDFSLHRNQAISYATGEWIFVLDADEEFHPSPDRGLRDELALAEKQGVEALSLRLESGQAAGRAASCFDAVRVFRNNGRIRYEGIVHEEPVGFMNFAPSHGRIVHCGYDLGPESARKKFERTATLLGKQIAANPENAAAHLYLSACYTSVGQNEEALQEALTAAELVEAQAITNKLFVNAYYTAARLHSQSGRLDEAEAICRRALERFGEQADILALGTKIRAEKKDWPGVVDSGGRFRAALDLYRNQRDKPELVSLCTYGDEWRVCCWMGTAKLHLGDIESAELLFARAGEISPDRLAVYRHAGAAFAEVGRFDRSRSYLEEAYRRAGADRDQAVVEGLFKVGLVTGDRGLVERSITDAGSLAGDGAAWLSELADFAVSQGDAGSALALLAGVVATHDGDVEARLKMAHILVSCGMIESAVTQCDALLRLLGLPRDRTLSSLEDLGNLFRDIAVALRERGQVDQAALASTVAGLLTTSANGRPDRGDGGIAVRPRISLCMIVRNEADCLERCLESVGRLVEEIVVVDTGSTDGTADIARRFGARVYPFPWDDDFSAARNFALSKVRGEWTLIMDADEVVAGKDLDKIRGLVESGRADGYRLTLRNYVNEVNLANAVPNPKDYPEGAGYPGFIPAPLIRLFRSSPDIRFTGCVHETLDASFVQAGRRIVDTGIPIHHYGKVMAERIRKKQAFYRDLGINKLLGTPDNPLAYKTLADQFLELDMPDQALEVAEEGLRRFADFAELHFDKGLALERSGLLQDAETAYHRAIERDSGHVGAHNNLAGILLRLGRPAEALGALQAARGDCMNHPAFCHTLGLVHSGLEDPAEALKYFDRALELAPRLKKVNNQKALVYLRRSEFDRAMKCLEREIEIGGDVVPALLTLGEIRLRKTEFREAIRYFQEALRMDPDNQIAKNYLKSIVQGVNP